MEVIISLDNRKLKRHLENCTKDYHYIYWGERKEDISQLLNQHTFKEINIDGSDDSAKDRLLESYIDLVGKLGQKYNSIYWWATDTAAKNPYGTKTCFDNLFIYYKIIRNIEEFRNRFRIFASSVEILSITVRCIRGSGLAPYCLRRE